MKYRIVKNPNGKYQVQYTYGWPDKYSSVSCRMEDYPSYNSLPRDQWCLHEEKRDYETNVFSTLELAQAKLQRELAEREAEKNRNKWKVIEVHKV